MTPESARATVFIEIVEAEDTAGEVLAHEARRSAEPPLSLSPRKRAEERAVALEKVLLDKRTHLARAARRWAHVGLKPAVLICVVAGVVGTQAQWLVSGRRAEFHILAPWLLFLLGSNAIMSFIGFIAMLRGAEAKLPWAGRAMVDVAAGLEMRGEPPAHRRILRAFRERWLGLAGPMLAAELRRTFHLASLSMVFGAMASAVITGMTTQFQATVESTFIHPEKVHTLVTTVLGPAVNLFGVALPPLPEGATGVIGEAKPWILGYGAAFALYVGMPRLLLVGLETLRHAVETGVVVRRAAPDRLAPYIDLALMSHTNIGKTSLTRTLLQNEAGEVRDAENVTQESEGYWMILTPEVGLRLWDTPGFGDVGPVLEEMRAGRFARFFKRFQEASQDTRLAGEIGGTLKEEADIVAYLVDASESPEEGTHVGPELEVLKEAGMPFVVILNHVGASTHEEHARLEAEWRKHLASLGHQPPIVSLDAHQRCWVQEASLLGAVVSLVGDHREAAGKLLPAWWDAQSLRLRTVTTSMAGAIRRVAGLTEHAKGEEERESAEKRLVEATLKEFDGVARTMLDIYGVAGSVGELILEVLEVETKSIVPAQDPGTRSFHAIVGGAISGLVSGVAADVMAGGLTLGGGAIVGAVLGAMGAAGASEGVHWAKHRNTAELKWGEPVLRGVLAQQCALYLAVAHYGRAKGDFNREEALERTHTWTTLIDRQLDADWKRLHKALQDPDILLPAKAFETLLLNLLTTLWPRTAGQLDLARRR